MTPNSFELTRLNIEKSLALASRLFPLEEWMPHGESIFVAKSRLIGSHKEQAKLYREIADVRILIGRGSAAINRGVHCLKNMELPLNTRFFFRFLLRFPQTVFGQKLPGN